MFAFSYLDVLHVLKEVRLWVSVVSELNQIPELLLGGERLDQAGEHCGVFMLHTLMEKRGVDQTKTLQKLLCAEFNVFI